MLGRMGKRPGQPPCCFQSLLLDPAGGFSEIMWVRCSAQCQYRESKVTKKVAADDYNIKAKIPERELTPVGLAVAVKSIVFLDFPR